MLGPQVPHMLSRLTVLSCVHCCGGVFWVPDTRQGLSTRATRAETRRDQLMPFRTPLPLSGVADLASA